MSYILSVLVFFCIHALLTMSLNLVLGYSGLVSVAQGALMGVGAYGAALLAINLGVNIFWAFFIGAAVAALVAVAFAYASLKMEGDNYILASFAFQAVLYQMMMQWVSLTRGSYGLQDVPRPSVFGAPLVDLTQYFLLVAAFTVFGAAILLYLAHSPFALALRGLREGERVVASLGKNPMQLRLMAFGLAGAFAGVAGGLQAGMIRFIHPDDFAITMSILVLTYVVAGGTGNMWGSIVGVAVLIVLPQAIRFVPFIPTTVLGPIQQIMYGVVLVGFVWFRPGGIVPERPIFRVGATKPIPTGSGSTAPGKVVTEG